jgi:hypothetical protein
MLLQYAVTKVAIEQQLATTDSGGILSCLKQEMA